MRRGGDEEGDPQRGVVDGGDERGRARGDEPQHDEGDRTGAARRAPAARRTAAPPRRPRPQVWMPARRSVVAPVALRRMSSVVQELRRTRRVRRLGDLEWFEVAYRVYLAALVGGGVVLWLSGLVTDEPATPAQVADVLDRGPAVLGARRRRRRRPRAAQRQRRRTGRRSRPPTSATCCWRRSPAATVLARPVVQRLRVGGVRRRARRRHRRPAGRPAAARHRARRGRPAVPPPARRPAPRSSPSPCSPTSPGCRAGWRPALAVARARRPGRRRRRVVAGPGRHDRQPRPLGHAPGARRPRRRRRRRRARRRSPSSLAGRLRVEPLVRRADLVSQLHFAVTMQDLRTVVLLRRQLRGERAAQPAVGAHRSPAAGHGGRAVWRRELARACCATRCRGSCGWRCSSSPPASPPSPSCAARRRRSSASASPCTCSASTPSSRCRRRSTTPTTPTACPIARGWLLAHHARRAGRRRSCRSPCSARPRSAVARAGRVARSRSPCACPSRWVGVVRRGRQHRARRPRPAGAAGRLVGRRAARVRRLHVDAAAALAARHQHARRRSPSLGVREQPTRRHGRADGRRRRRSSSSATVCVGAPARRVAGEDPRRSSTRAGAAGTTA